MEETVIPFPFPGRNLMTELGIEITKRGEDGAAGRLALSEAVQQGAGPIFHGGAIIALADTVASVACLGRIDPTFATAADPRTVPVAVQISSSLVSNANSGSLRCESVVIHAGRRMMVASSTITAEDGRLVAQVTSTHLRPVSDS